MADRFLVTSVLLNALKQCFFDVISLILTKLRYSQSILFERTFRSWSFFFRIVWIIECRGSSFRYMLTFFHFLLHHTTFLFDAQNLLLFITLAILSLYQSPVYCRYRKVRGNFTHKVNDLRDICSSGLLCCVEW